MRFALRFTSLVPCFLFIVAACGGSDPPSGGDGDGDDVVGDGDGDDAATGGGQGDGDGDGDMQTGLCAPGTTQQCTGTNDAGVCSGAQACNSDGMSWGVCDCGGDGSGGAGTGGDASGGAGSGGEGTGGAGTGGDASGGAGSGGEGTGGAATGGAASGAGGAGTGGEGSGGVTNYGNFIVGDVDGWVDPASNDVGVSGFYWTNADGNGSDVSEFPDTSTEGDVCFSGRVGVVNLSCGEENCYDETWGAQLGLNLNQDSESVVSSWDATSSNIDGFKFLLSGDRDGAHLRMSAIVNGEEINYCTPLNLGVNTIRFSDFKHSCWLPEPGLVDATNLEAIHFHVVADATEAHDYDLCVENLEAVGQPTPGLSIRPYTGWVDNTQNTVGIEGAAFTFADDAGSSITPANFEEFGSSLCVEGTVAQVDLDCLEPDCYAVYWGSAIGFALNQTGPLDMGNPSQLPYDAEAAGVDGFSFNLSNGDGGLGYFGGAQVRLGVRVEGDPTVYCAYLEPGQNSVNFDDVYANCWDVTSTDTPDSSQVTSIEWQVTTDQFDSYDYQFCVENIRAL